MSSNPNAVEAVERLIRPHLNYDEDMETYRHLRTLGRIVCTHGARPAAVLRLARDGRFSGGNADKTLAGEFFTNPNLGYQWEETEVGHGLIPELIEYKTGVNAFLKGISYSETREVPSGNEDEPVEDLSTAYGVVIAFNKKVLTPGCAISEDIRTSDPELVLPKAPSIETIEGIYPVDAEAAEALTEALSELPGR